MIVLAYTYRGCSSITHILTRVRPLQTQAGLFLNHLFGNGFSMIWYFKVAYLIGLFLRGGIG